MNRRMLSVIYSAVLATFGLAVFFFGATLSGVEISVQSGGAGMRELGAVVKVIGGGMGLAGVAGLIWAIFLAEEKRLEGYGGLNTTGLVTLVVPFFFVGPFWLLVAWMLWRVPALRA